jgi:indolepyruvate ferredoxin oxidoreductase alpha subunit
VDFKAPESIKNEIAGIIPPRPPILCAGCGHRNAFFAINIVEKKMRLKSGVQGGGIIKPSDIGCYTLGYQPPLHAVDTNFCMGASIGIGGGLSHVTDEKIVCTIGDSTFFHSGIPPLINAVFNNARITIIILENETTAMTGYQPHPGTGARAGGIKTKKIQIEDVVKACGVDVIKIIDMFNLSHLIDALEDCLQHEGVSVIVAKGYCAIQKAREDASKGTRKYCYVDSTTCTRCLHCMTKFGCPAMQLIDEKVEINQELCTGCSVCLNKNVCPKSVIKMACDS